MRATRSQAPAIVLLALSAATAAHSSDYPFKVKTLNVSDTSQIVAINDGPVPVSLRVALTEATNIYAKPALPAVVVLAAHQARTIATLRAVNPAVGGSRFSYTSAWIPGDARSQPDQATYRVPVMEGQPVRVGQAPGGGEISTHNTVASRFAVDFDLPEGTAVVAARDGVVMDARDDFTAGGPDPSLGTKANFVEVIHEDGTIAVYAHLIHKGLRVHRGDSVRAGALLGYSGNTGYSTGPHLHFAVQQVVASADGFERESIPFRMHSTPTGAPFVPVRGLVVLTDGSLRWPDAAASSNPNESLLRLMKRAPAPIRRLIETMQQWSVWGWLAVLGTTWGGLMLVTSVAERRRQRRLMFERDEPRF
jgi:murein DD-endopeptidase MepM/ murein hydrolase activator NlpD